MKYPVTAVLLAGGKSSRMGTAKANLRWGEKTLLEHAYSAVESFANEVIVAGNNHQPDFWEPYQTVADLPEVQGPLAGLIPAMKKAKYPWVFALACDLPFFEPAVFEWIWSHKSDLNPAFIPQKNDYSQPLCALYHTSLLPTLENQSAQGNFSLFKIMQATKARFIKTNLNFEQRHPNAFFNLNTPEDWEWLTKNHPR